MSADPQEFRVPAWIRDGIGRMPRVSWIYSSGKGVKAIALARETADLFVADDDRGLARIDGRGELSYLTRLPRSARMVAVSDDGQWGTAVVDYGTIYRFDRSLKFVWETELSEPCMAIAMAPFGYQTAIALSDGATEILNERKRRIAKFETVRPLASLEFCTQAPLLFGAAEHGLVGCYELNGGEVWQERFWSNVGDLATTGDGDLVYLAGSAHGVQTLDGDGASVGAYVVEGTVRRVACSYETRRVIASTIERQLFVMDSQGDVIWQAETPEDVVDIACDAFGDEVTVALTNGEIFRLDWGGI
ncbi:hypothetical protein Pan44_33540 [Caulifigura coniformis]|uniref:WD40 repeat domain-containing protein n=1 Tax=Caulifigura coniformis TaxID=2527983 RepID=A0A517SGR4_9PLAN|nr:hypothetical protein [Caulifigura coniformis]QDT55311.1 hypothetical protein Pan44_33540 [Caulifigura coniformis]